MSDLTTSNDTEVLIGRWLADVFGTHPGQGYLIISRLDGNLVADLRFSTRGQTTHSTGRIAPDGKTITFEARQGQPPASVVITIETRSPSALWGHWTSADGGAGAASFRNENTTQPGPSVQPAQSSSTQAANDISSLQLIVREKDVPPVVVTKDHVKALAHKLSVAIPTPGTNTIFMSNTGASSSRKLEDAWFNDTTLPDTLDHLVLWRVENTQGIQKTITVQLSQRLGNRITVQSSDETWTTGTAIALEEFLKPRMFRVASLAKRYAISFVGLFTFASVVIMTPEFSIWQRTVFVLFALAIAYVFNKLMGLVATTVIILNKEAIGWWRSVSADIFAALAAAAVAATFGTVVTLMTPDQLAQRVRDFWHDLAAPAATNPSPAIENGSLPQNLSEPVKKP